MTRLEEIENHTENLKLASDDHGHDCTALREYCEHELINYADNYIPWLINRVKELENVIKFADHILPMIEHTEEVEDLMTIVKKALR